MSSTKSGSRGRPGRRETVALAVLGTALVIAPQLLGGVYPWGMIVIALLAAGALTTALWVNQGRTEVRGMLWWVALLALAWTVVQALPMPCMLVGLLAPESVENLTRVHALLDRGPPVFCTLSRDPGATRQEIVKGLAMLCFYASALILVQLGQRRNVLRALAGAGGALALVSVAHAVTGADRVFGVYAPVEVRDQPFLAPLLNLNSLGGALALCWPIALAFAITTREKRERAVWLVAATVLATTVLMTRSRGAVGALALELVLFALLGLRVRGRAPARAFETPQERWSVALAIAAVIGISIYSSYTDVVVEFEKGAWDKLRLIAAAGSFALDHFWFGVGRGAFSAVFAAAHNGGVRRFEYPENFVVQWAAEWGTPLCVLLLAVVAAALINGARKVNTLERCAAIAGILGLAAQNLVDLGFELVGLAVLAAVALACACGDRTSTSTPRGSAFRTPLSALALSTLITAAALGPGLLREYPGTVTARVRDAIARGSRAEVKAQVAVGMYAHPNEPSFVLLMAGDALRRGDPTAGRWINRALQLAPEWAAPHLLASSWLWNAGHHKQAVLELTAATRADFQSSRDFACRIAHAWPRGIIAVAAKLEAPADFLEQIAHCRQLTDQEAIAVDRGILHFDPKAAPARLRESRRAQRSGQYQQALTLARAVQRDHGNLPEAVGEEAAALMAMGQIAQAREVVTRGLRHAPGERNLQELELVILTKLRDRAALARVFAFLRGRAEGTQELAALYHREAAIEAELGNPGAALRAYQQAYDVAEDPASLRAVANTARSMGDMNRARRVYAQLCTISPEDVASCESAKATEHPIMPPTNERGESAAQQFLK